MVNSTLTQYGNLITPRMFEKIRDKSMATKINAYKKTSSRIPVHKERFVEDALFIQVPRAVCKVKHINREEPDTLTSDYDMPSLMKYQTDIVQHISEKLHEDSHMFLQMDTGLGKSYVAAGLVVSMKVKTCIVVANKSLSKQMEEQLTQAVPGINVKKYSSTQTSGECITVGKKKVYVPSCDVLLIIINTACKMPADFFSHFGLVIYDEVHSYCSEKYSDVFFNADTARYIFGMTATPSRLDGMETISYLHLGEPIFASTLSDDDEMDPGNFYGTFHAVHYTGPPSFTKTIKSSAGVPSPILMANQFLSDPFRLTLAAMIIIDAYNAGRYIYIFCQTRDPLDNLRRRIINTVPKESRDLLKKELFIVTGKSKDEESTLANTNARIFLTTYMLSSKGLSNPRFDTLLLLTPMKSNMMQITGRIFRKKSDEGRRRLIIDLVDDRTFINKQHSKRVQSIASRGLTIAHDSMNYKNIGIEKSIRGLLNKIDAYNIYRDDDTGFDGYTDEMMAQFRKVYGDNVERKNKEREEWPVTPTEKIREFLIEYMSDDEEEDEIQEQIANDEDAED